GFSRSVFIIDFLLTLIFVAGFRLSIRLYFSSFKGSIGNLLHRRNQELKRILIIGAGDAGEGLFREIDENPSLGFAVAGFLDDDQKKRGLRIHGIPVLGTTDDVQWICGEKEIDEILIAVPSASGEEMRRIAKGCERTGLRYKTIPGIPDLINGKVSIKALRDVSYEDLLRRKPVHLEMERISEYLKGERVLVTGAGGTIGSELCKQLLRFKPESLILVERGENNLYEIQKTLSWENDDGVDIYPCLVDIQDIPRLEALIKGMQPTVVFHAAAYKHVPMMEFNPLEAIKNNILGTRNVAMAAQQQGLKCFVMISTDKAVQPTNIMGASKRVAELIVQGLNTRSRTKFVTVRFGNVAGSTGSVIPLFQQQIARGGPVTVTDPEVTRYFMTIPEACQLILQAGSMARGGEIHILDMGKPIRIADLAEDLIRYSGREPYKEIDIVYTGLRPGEKLHEELFMDDEVPLPTAHPKIKVAKGNHIDWSWVCTCLDKLERSLEQNDTEMVIRNLKEMVPGYQPQDNGLKIKAPQYEETSQSSVSGTSEANVYMALGKNPKL
ncbi:MAG: polysaccharide biosynthesis protein, partial [Thermodesulfobacteriota bacterium]